MNTFSTCVNAQTNLPILKHKLKWNRGAVVAIPSLSPSSSHPPVSDRLFTGLLVLTEMQDGRRGGGEDVREGVGRPGSVQWAQTTSEGAFCSSSSYLISQLCCKSKTFICLLFSTMIFIRYQALLWWNEWQRKCNKKILNKMCPNWNRSFGRGCCEHFRDFSFWLV